VTNTTPWPPYPKERRGTHCIGRWVGPATGLGGPRDRSGWAPRPVWVGPATGLDGCGKSRPHRNSISGPSSYPSPQFVVVTLHIFVVKYYPVSYIIVNQTFFLEQLDVLSFGPCIFNDEDKK